MSLHRWLEARQNRSAPARCCAPTAYASVATSQCIVPNLVYRLFFTLWMNLHMVAMLLVSSQLRRTIEQLERRQVSPSPPRPAKPEPKPEPKPKPKPKSKPKSKPKKMARVG